MKQNISLQTTLNFLNYAQRAYYKASLLLAASTSSPAIKVRDALAGVIGKRAIPAYAGFTAIPALTAAANTIGYAVGGRFPGRPAVAAVPASGGYAAVSAIPALVPSPAYAIGVAVPAYPAVAARVAQIEVMPVTAITAVSSPAVAAIKGYEDAIDIVVSASSVIITAQLPAYTGVEIVGSNKLVIGEITPTALQATAWLDTKAALAPDTCITLDAELATDTLEQSFYKDALECEHVVSDVVRNVNGTSINCKQVVVTLYTGVGFNPLSDSLQLDKIKIAP